MKSTRQAMLPISQVCANKTSNEMSNNYVICSYNILININQQKNKINCFTHYLTLHIIHFHFAYYKISMQFCDSAKRKIIFKKNHTYNTAKFESS